MLQKLRIRFILIASTAIVVILSAVIGILNSVQHLQTNGQINTILTVLSNNGGRFPGVDEIKDDFGRPANEDFINQYRYFSILMEDAEVISSYTDRIAEFSDQEILDYAHDLLASDRPRGQFSRNTQHYAYQVTRQRNNRALIVVVDVTTFYEARDNLFRLSLILFLASLAVFILIVSLLSGRAIQPFVVNMQKQKRFITNAGHELKTPLAIISANTEVQEMLTGETEWSRSTREQTVRMTDLVNQMISLARLEEQPDLVLEDVNFSEVTQKAAQNFTTLALKDEKKLDMVIQPDLMVKAEAKSLYELVNILVDNAVKYCDPKGFIHIILSRQNGLRRRARLEISNTFAAGKDVDYSRFFDRFYREDSSHNSQTKGYGIGLSMAESMIKLFKGKIEVVYKEDTISFIVQLW